MRVKPTGPLHSGHRRFSRSQGVSGLAILFALVLVAALVVALVLESRRRDDLSFELIQLRGAVRK